MKLVSFYADVDGKTYYSDSAQKLRQQCESMGIDHHIVEQGFGKSWIDNVRAKPQFLLNVLEEIKAPFVWLDCDCYVLRPLDFQVNAEWGIYLRDDGTPHDFVHYIYYSEKTKNFLRKWIEAIDQQQRGSHTAFISIFDELESQVLPEGYFELGLAETDSKQTYFDNA